MNEIKLKFAEPSRRNAIVAAVDGRAAATIRHDDEKAILADDTLAMADADGEPFGRAKVLRAETAPLMDVWEEVAGEGYVYPEDSFASTLAALNQYYDDDISTDDEVKLIVFQPVLDSIILHARGGAAAVNLSGDFLVDTRESAFGTVLDHGLDGLVIFMGLPRIGGWRPLDHATGRPLTTFLSHQTYKKHVESWLSRNPGARQVAVVSLTHGDWKAVYARDGYEPEAPDGGNAP